MRRFGIYEVDDNDMSLEEIKVLNEDEYLADAVRIIGATNRLRWGNPRHGEQYFIKNGFGQCSRMERCKMDFTEERLILDPHPDTLMPKDPIEAHLANMPNDICGEVQDWIKEYDRLVREKGDDT